MNACLLHFWSRLTVAFLLTLSLASRGAAQSPPDAQRNIAEQLRSAAAKYPPEDAELVLALDAQGLMAHPLGALLQSGLSIYPEGEELAQFGVHLYKVDWLLCAAKLPVDPSPPHLQYDIDRNFLRQAVVVVGFTDEKTLKKLMGLLKQFLPIAGEASGIKLYAAPGMRSSPGSLWVCGAIDEKTLIYGSAIEVTKSLTRERAPKWLGEVSFAADSKLPLKIAVESSAIARLLDREDLKKVAEPYALLKGLWTKSSTIQLGVSATSESKVEIDITFKDAGSAKEVEGGLKALQEELTKYCQAFVAAHPQMSLPYETIYRDQYLFSLGQTTITQDEKLVHASLPLGSAQRLSRTYRGQIAQSARLLSGASPEEMAIIEESLKKLALALHEYHDVHGAFPPAVLYGGKEGKTRYSWRVAILPYLGHKELYEQYNFDEDWRSDKNREVMHKMPDLFRHPLERRHRHMSGYFAIQGKETVLTQSGVLVKRDSIPDGASNTVMLVEAKRAILWTQPEDLPFDVPAEDLGSNDNYFFAALADGAVKQISKQTDAETLKSFFSPRDGKVVPIP